jgi:hypothetical protein
MVVPEITPGLQSCMSTEFPTQTVASVPRQTGFCALTFTEIHISAIKKVSNFFNVILMCLILVACKVIISRRRWKKIVALGSIILFYFDSVQSKLILVF